MEKDAFQTLKETCKQACHERHACANGYKQMLASNNVSQMMATWRDNLEDVVESKFADIIRAELPKQYPALRQEMNQAGIYLNECPERAPSFVMVIITDCETPIHIYDRAQAYVIGEATVVAHGHSQVYNNKYNAIITLLDHAYGNIQAGKVQALDHSVLKNNMQS